MLLTFKSSLFLKKHSLRLFCLSIFLLLPIGNSLAFNSGELNKSPAIMGYYSQWSIYSPNIHIRDLPTHLMTHLVYKSADLTKEGDVILGDSYADIEFLYPGADRNDQFLGSFGQLIKVKERQPELKAIISIGGWGRSEHFSTLASSKNGRIKLAKSAIQFMQKYQFDGIEIDWQFPIYRASSTKITSYRKEDAKHLNLLLAELKRQCEQLNIDCWIQAVLAPYSLEKPWDASLLSNSVDAIVVDVTRLPGDVGELAEPQSPLFAKEGERSVDTVINTMVGYGMKRDKIVMSIASFAVGWEGVPAKNNGFKQPHKTLSWGSWDSRSSGATGIYNQKNLTYFLATGEYKHYWNEFGKSDYVYNPDKYDGHFISYEGYKSIAAKTDYVKQNKLAGVAIIQLHHGDAALFNVFAQFHFVKSSYYKLIQFWQDNSAALIVLFQMLTVMVIGITVFILLHTKKTKESYLQKQQFKRIQYWMQSIEWPLLNVVTVAKHAQEKRLLRTEQVELLSKLSAEVLRPISSIISETTLKSSVNQGLKEVVDLQQIIQNVATLLAIENKRLLTWNKDVKARLLINPDKFQQFLFYICDYVNQQSSSKEAIVLNIVAINERLQLNVLLPLDTENNHVSHTRLNTLFHQAKLLGLTISFDKGERQLSVLISKDVFASSKYLDALIFKFDQKVMPISSLQIGEDKSEEHNEKQALVTQEGPKSIEEYSTLFTAITSFNMSAEPSKDIYKGLEQACQYFIDILQQDAKVNIIHHEHVVSKLGKETLISRHEILVNSDDVTVEVVTQQELSEAEQQLIQVLVYQTLMVQKAIQSLLKEPSILAELYELTRYKERIKYLKAESGYTGIYIQSLKEPRYISMRLRTIKQYFDDITLVQVHRSYLVNPKKVNRINAIAKLKFELELGTTKIPVSRTYIPMLKENFPHWFS